MEMDGVGIEQKSFRSKRYENLLDVNPKDTKTFWNQRYENLLDPKDTKTF